MKGIGFFSKLDKEEIEKVLEISKVETRNKGDILFYEKDKKDFIYFLIEGSVKFYKVDRFENEVFLYKIDKGSLIFDYCGFLKEGSIGCYSNTEFLSDSKALIVDTKKFYEIFGANEKVLKILLSESFKLIQQLQCVISRDVVFDGTAKVAHMLVNDTDTFNNMKKHEVAYMLHLQPETLSRIIKKLEREEFISISKNQIEILNSKALREIYEG